MDFQSIVARFPGDHRKTADGFMVKCPHHSDKNQSLHISQNGNRTLLHCFAGCETRDILESVGLKEADLYDEPMAKSGKDGSGWLTYLKGAYAETLSKKVGQPMRFVTYYDYVKFSGEYALTNVRYQGADGKKEMRQGIRQANGKIKMWLDGYKKQKDAAAYVSSYEKVRAAKETGETVYIFEGEKDVDTATAAGLLGITSGSAGSWYSEYTRWFVGCNVVVVADNDPSGQKYADQVTKGIGRVVKSLKVVTPSEIEKGDFTDFLEIEGHTLVEFLRLVEVALEIKRTDNDGGADAAGDGTAAGAGDNGSGADADGGADGLDRFHKVGSKNGKRYDTIDDEIFRDIIENNRIIIIGDTPYLYEGGFYVPDSGGYKLRTMIKKYIDLELITDPRIDRIYRLFTRANSRELRVYDRAGVEVGYLGCNRQDRRWIPFKNGFWDPINRVLVPHDPEYLTMYQIPHEYDPERSTDSALWREWLDFICPAPDDREMVLQYAGYCMTMDAGEQKFLVLKGEGGTGKSTLIRVINAMVGGRNMSAVSLDDLTQRFQSYALVGKVLNSCADIKTKMVEDVSKLKELLGEDTFMVEKKHEQPFEYRNFAKLIFSANEIPAVKDERSNGFYRRIMIHTMDRVPDHTDPRLADRLIESIDVFITMAVQALERMYQFGGLQESFASKEAVARLRCDSDTVEGFLLDECEIKDGLSVRRADLYTAYESWCKDEDRTALTRFNFFKALRTKRHKEKKVHGVDYFDGIGLIRDQVDFVPVPDQVELPFG